MTDDQPLYSGRSFRLGFQQALPVALAYVAIGAAMGVLGAEAGMSVGQVGLLSLTVYSGATQFAAAGLIAAGAGATALITTALLLTLRHLVLAASIAPHLTRAKWWHQVLIAFGLTDEAYALAMGRFTRQGPDLGYLIGVMATLYPAWVAATVAGAAVGGLIPDPKIYGLDFAFPACFLGLVVPTLKRARDWAAALAGVAIALFSAPILPGSLNLLAAGALGPVVGLAVDRAGRRKNR